MNLLRRWLLRMLGADDLVLERDATVRLLTVAESQVQNLRAERNMWRAEAIRHGAPER